MVRQNSFLYVTTATSVVNAGNGDELFTSKTGDKDKYDRSIREWEMKAKTADGVYLFHSVEEGIRGNVISFTRQRKREKLSNGSTSSSTEYYNSTGRMNANAS